MVMKGCFYIDASVCLSLTLSDLRPNVSELRERHGDYRQLGILNAENEETFHRI